MCKCRLNGLLVNLVVFNTELEIMYRFPEMTVSLTVSPTPNTVVSVLPPSNLYTQVTMAHCDSGTWNPRCACRRLVVHTENISTNPSRALPATPLNHFLPVLVQMASQRSTFRECISSFFFLKKELSKY